MSRIEQRGSLVRETALNFARGFGMGSADAVPGVSGGTIALLLGIYERLVDSIRDASSATGRLLAWDREAAVAALRRVEWGLVVPLLAGVLIAVVLLASVLERLLEDHPIQISALFFGLIAGSVIVVWEMIEGRGVRELAVAVVAALITFVLLGLREQTTAETGGVEADPALLAFGGGGMLAICAMILPGVSGSFLLVLVGMYAALVEAVNDRELVQLAVFALGAAIGLGLFSQLLSWLLHRYHDVVMAALVGLMAGSVRVLWPWPDGLQSTALGSPGEFVPEAVGLALGAAVLVVGLTRLGRRMETEPPG